MIQTTRGFTLIELLVVVLIIGILAAVAVPQYQKAVLKARLVQMRVYMDALHKGAELHYLEKGGYSRNPQDYDIELNAKEVSPSTISSNQDGLFFDNDIECVTTLSSVACNSPDVYLVRKHDHVQLNGWPNGIVCKGLNKRAEQACLSMSKGEEANLWPNSELKAYVIDG